MVRHWQVKWDETCIPDGVYVLASDCNRLEVALRQIRGIAPLGIDTYRECYRRIQQIAGEALGITPCEHQ